MSERDKAAAQEVWGASPAGWTFGGGAEPGTREYFERVIERRSAYEQPWLRELYPFADVAGKDVLEIGCGAGYDAYEFVSRGSTYTGVDITPENIERTRAHLALYGYSPRVQLADAESLPFADESFDIAYSNGVLHHVPHIEVALAEARRVLRPGGEIWLLVYHRNSVFYRLSVVLDSHILRGGFLRRSLRERRSMIEFSTSDALPLVNVYSRREVDGLLERAGFVAKSMAVRKLKREDLPGRPLSLLFRGMSDEDLERLGRRWGWYVAARARR